MLVHKESVEKDLFDCSVNKIRSSSFYSGSTSDVKMVCAYCAGKLRDQYDLEDHIVERDYIGRFDIFNNCD